MRPPSASTPTAGVRPHLPPDLQQDAQGRHPFRRTVRRARHRNDADGLSTHAPPAPGCEAIAAKIGAGFRGPAAGRNPRGGSRRRDHERRRRRKGRAIILSFCNSPMMNAIEAYIQFTPGLISDSGEGEVELNQDLSSQLYERVQRLYGRRPERLSARILSGTLNRSRQTRRLSLLWLRLVLAFMPNPNDATPAQWRASRV